jgi:hypothetical protein
MLQTPVRRCLPDELIPLSTLKPAYATPLSPRASRCEPQRDPLKTRLYVAAMVPVSISMFQRQWPPSKEGLG